MSGRSEKRQRRAVRKVVNKKQNEIIDSFRKFIDGLPFKQRIKVAWKIITKTF
jgi:hypothetical protein